MCFQSSFNHNGTVEETNNADRQSKLYPLSSWPCHRCSSYIAIFISLSEAENLTHSYPTRISHPCADFACHCCLRTIPFSSVQRHISYARWNPVECTHLPSVTLHCGYIPCLDISKAGSTGRCR